VTHEWIYQGVILTYKWNFSYREGNEKRTKKLREMKNASRMIDSINIHKFQVVEFENQNKQLQHVHLVGEDCLKADVKFKINN
jgi:hypothetical protein